jgi:PD-(D/E)XK nuclease superfamily
MTEKPDERLGLPSASNWHRYELCPGSWQLEQEARRLGQVAHERSVDAARGERIHAFLAGVPDEDGNEIKLSESEQTTADFLQERAQGPQGQVQRIFGDEPTRSMNEKRLWLSYQGKKALSGRFDRVVYTPTKALVQDFKTGFSEPDPAEQNAQLKVLAVLVGLELPAVEEVIVQIISGPYGVSEARYDVAALGKAYHEIIVTLRAIQDPLAMLAPQPAACRYCSAVNICPAVKNLVPRMIEVEALPDGERGAKLLDEVAVLQNRLDAIREYYSVRLTDDPSYAIPGYAMVPGNTRREVTDWTAARQRLAEWLDLPEIEGAANYRLGELEKALGKKLKLKGKELKERTNQILAGLLEEKQNAASLKRVVGKAQLVTVELP